MTDGIRRRDSDFDISTCIAYFRHVALAVLASWDEVVSSLTGSLTSLISSCLLPNPLWLLFSCNNKYSKYCQERKLYFSVTMCNSPCLSHGRGRLVERDFLNTKWCASVNKLISCPDSWRRGLRLRWQEIWLRDYKPPSFLDGKAIAFFIF